MTDRELLELAAISYGFELGDWDEKLGCWWDKDGMDIFNPLQDDGDALRLAAALCFSFIQYKHSIEILIGDELIHRELSDGTMTRIELTRRAITSAAAQIQLNKEKANG